VEVNPREINVYQTEDNQEPFWKFVDTLSGTETYNRILKRIDRAGAGNLGKWDAVGGGVFELILDFGKGYRIYFGLDGDVLVLLLAGIKKTQTKDIAKAKEYWKIYNA
jgi:putative addiction module killer protein